MAILRSVRAGSSDESASRIDRLALVQGLGLRDLAILHELHEVLERLLVIKHHVGHDLIDGVLELAERLLVAVSRVFGVLVWRKQEGGTVSRSEFIPHQGGCLAAARYRYPQLRPVSAASPASSGARSTPPQPSRSLSLLSLTVAPY